MFGISEFITLLGGAAVAWPLAARAQQAERMRRVGALMALGADDPQSPVRVAEFAQELQQLGWNVDKCVRYVAYRPRFRRLAHRGRRAECGLGCEIRMMDCSRLRRCHR